MGQALLIVERLPRVVFRVTGEGPLGYLHDVLAQDVAGLADGRGAIAAVLTANGRIAAEVRVIPVDDAVLLDAEEAARPGIEEHIGRHAGLAGCDVEDLSPAYTAAAVRGSDADAQLESAGVPVPAAAEAASVRVGEVHVVRVIWGVAGFDLLGPSGAVEALLSRMEGPRVAETELDAARIDAGRPRFGPDLNGDLLVNETPLLAHGVSMAKGCYPGQESVARVHNLGNVRRIVRGLRAPGSLKTGAAVHVDGAVVGKVTSAAEAPSGGSAAIAVLRREVEPGSFVDVDGGRATVEELR